MKRRAHREREKYESLGLAYVYSLNHRKEQVTPRKLRWWKAAAREVLEATSDQQRMFAVIKLGERSVNMGLPYGPLRPRGRSLHKLTLTTFDNGRCTQAIVELPAEKAVVREALKVLLNALDTASASKPPGKK